MRNGSRTLNRCALETCFSMEFPCLLVLYKAYQLRKMKMYYLLPGQNFHKCRTKSIAYPSLPILGTLDGSVLLWALPLWEFSPFFTACCLIAKSCLTLFDLMDCISQAPLSMGFSRQECWSGFLCPPPGDLPDPGSQPMSQVSCIGADSEAEPPGKTSDTVPPPKMSLLTLIIFQGLECHLFGEVLPLQLG